MSLLNIKEDNLFHLIQHLDVVSFIILLSTCKHFYKSRKICQRFLPDCKKYNEYAEGSLITELLNSYINLPYFSLSKYNVNSIQKSISKIDHKKTKNTLSIIGYSCLSAATICVFDSYKTDTILLEICCKTVCRKYRYKYTQPYAKLYCLFWNNWFKSCVNILDICELAYHIKNRKYRNVYNTLSAIQFRSQPSNVFDTLSFIVNYIEMQCDNKFKAILFCLLFMYISRNIDDLSSNVNNIELFRATAIMKAEEISNRLEKMLELPTYLRIYIQSQIIQASNMLVVCSQN